MRYPPENKSNGEKFTRIADARILYLTAPRLLGGRPSSVIQYVKANEYERGPIYFDLIEYMRHWIDDN